MKLLIELLVHVSASKIATKYRCMTGKFLKFLESYILWYMYIYMSIYKTSAVYFNLINFRPASFDVGHNHIQWSWKEKKLLIQETNCISVVNDSAINGLDVLCCIKFAHIYWILNTVPVCSLHVWDLFSYVIVWIWTLH